MKKEKSKEIHFYMRIDKKEFARLKKSGKTLFVVTYEDTRNEILANNPYIQTSCLANLNTSLFELGYRVFIHNDPRNQAKKFELKLGKENPNSVREIKKTSDLLGLLIAGIFSSTRERY